MSDRPTAFDAYEALAEAYAAVVDTKPHNAYYERPATLSLLPDVRGKRVLDAGCGPGAYSEWLIGRGAEVVAVDASPKMVELARRRLGDAVEVREADLSKPLAFRGVAGRLRGGSAPERGRPYLRTRIRRLRPLFKSFFPVFEGRWE